MKALSNSLVKLSIVCIGVVFSLWGDNAVTPIMNHNLAAFTPSHKQKSYKTFKDYLEQSMLSQENLDPFTKRKAAWQIVERCHNTLQQPSSLLCNDEETWDNLQLLRGEEGKHRLRSVASLVDRTSTEVGRVMLHTWVAQPTDDVELLLKRQSCVKQLMHDEELFNKLDALLQDIKNSENFFLSFWGEDPFKRFVIPESYEATEKSFFRIKALENSVSYLNYKECNAHGSRLMTLLGTGLCVVAFPLYEAWNAALAAQGETGEHNRHYQLMKIFTEFSGSLSPLAPLHSFYKQMNSWMGKFSGGSSAAVQKVDSFLEIPLLKRIIGASASFLAAIRAKYVYESVENNFLISMCLQRKMSSVGNVLHSLESISSLMHEHPDITIPSGINLYELMKNTKQENAKITMLLELLATDTFKEEPSWRANYGAIKLAYKFMHKKKELLEPLLYALGELDVCMSTARLYKEFKNERVHYCFAHYADKSNGPLIAFDHLWSPFIDPTTVVPNSMSLGGANNPRNLIVTGPNEGGKSTFVKTMIIAIILAQSIGIVPATEATVTPVSYAGTYLNVGDNHEKSLFEAQVARVKHLIEQIEKMPTDQYSFVLIDELFNGTNAQVGEATSYSIADYLSKKPQVISVFPTHFPKLTLLEQSGSSVNYKVSAHVDPTGAIRYPFTIEKGISTQNLVLNILQNEGFNPTILAQAAQILKQKDTPSLAMSFS